MILLSLNEDQYRKVSALLYNSQGMREDFVDFCDSPQGAYGSIEVGLKSCPDSHTFVSLCRREFNLKFDSLPDGQMILSNVHGRTIVKFENSMDAAKVLNVR